MADINITTILDHQLIAAFGFDEAEIAQATLDLAAEEIGLRDWHPHANDILAFQRVHQLEGLSEDMMKTDNYRNLLVGQAADMRVILILIAMNVVLMRRTKDTPAVEAQRHLSVMAASIYAPIAHKLGLYKLKSELEDLSLKYLEHDAYYMIKEELNATKKSRDAYVERFITPIREALDAAGLKYHVKGRTKSIHSIWQKMKKQKCGFAGVRDLFAIRIILDSKPSKELADCWKVFSIVTDMYNESDLKRLRDWVTVPKSNGYESLHITVLGPEDKWVEVQIRTERMDEVAEHGLAAHWRYKGVKSSAGGVDDWLAGIRASLEAGKDPQLTQETALQETTIYVFTPKGDLYRLPAGATLLDFAYHIHSGVGNKCVGGIVNGKNVPIRQQLESGQKVEVLTSNKQQPNPDWLNVVVSTHAKNKIRQALREIQSRDSAMGREILERKLRNRKLEWDETCINLLIKKKNAKDASEFFRAIVEESYDLNDLIDTYVELQKREQGTAERAATRSAEEFSLDSKVAQSSLASAAPGLADGIVIGQDMKGLDFQMAQCCSPVYGDEVFGFVSSSGGIKIHRKTCPNAADLHDRYSYRIVRARWAGKGSSNYPITLHVVGQDDLGIVNNLTSIISKEQHIMLRNISIESHDGLFYGVLTVLVDDTMQLNTLIKKLRTVKGVKAVSR
ncbi:MAG: TGS domain-containing protein [Bacteroidales bacterium]|nr:TGS domain-containing protein [Bacteroidales bacterium]